MGAPITRATVPESAVADFAADYADCFRVTSFPGRHSAADWAEATLRGSDGVFGRVVWHGLLGFELAPSGTAGSLVGWRIAEDAPGRFVMEADGPRMAGRMTFDVEGQEVRWTTALRYHGRVAALIWSGAGIVHRQLAPRSLDDARRSLAR